MKLGGIVFREGAASRGDIYSHLNDCNDSYKPALNERVDLLEYSIKISENACTFEAWSNKLLVGLVAVYLNKSGSSSAYITDVSVRKEYMGRGIASKLLEMCLKKVKECNFHEIVLEVSSGNKRAADLYRRHGFKGVDVAGESMMMKLVFNED